MVKIKSASELTSKDWQIIHIYRNTRALARRTKLPKFKSECEKRMAICEAYAREHGLPAQLMNRWRAYPARGCPPVRRDSPDQEDRRMWDAYEGRAERKPKEPPAEDAGELLALLEASVAEQMKRSRPA